MIETSLSEKISEAQTYKDKAEIVWNHYLGRKLPPGDDTLEPGWIHSGYESVQRFLFGEIDAEETKILHQIINSHSLKDGYAVPAFPGQPKSPMRIIHDGWKAGTPTWIFMGRSLTKNSVISLGGGWVAVNRTIPDEFYKELDQQSAPAMLWMAYNTDKQMGLNAMTSNVIGPAVSLDQLRKAVYDWIPSQ